MTYENIKDLIIRSATASLGTSVQKSDFKIKNKYMDKLVLLLNKSKRSNDIERIKSIRKLIISERDTQREKILTNKKKKLANSYVTDTSTFYKEINKTTNVFQDKKPKLIENDIKLTLKIFHDWWSNYFNLQGFSSNEDVIT